MDHLRAHAYVGWRLSTADDRQRPFQSDRFRRNVHRRLDSVVGGHGSGDRARAMSTTGGQDLMETLWFILVVFMLTAYVVLDGFDLGIGAIHVFVAKTDVE